MKDMLPCKTSFESVVSTIGFNDLPPALTARWQGTANLLADLLDVPVALVMKTENDFMEVAVSSHTEDNPYRPGDREHWEGLYCQTVIQKQEKLVVVNALKDPHWDHNPDIKLGMVAYMGIPINFPNGRPYGTICVLDRKERHFTDRETRVLMNFRHSIEADLRSVALHIQAERQQEALRESRELYRMLVDYAADLIWTMNGEGRFTYVSPSFETVLGYDPGYMTGQAFRPFVHPDDIPGCEDYLQRVLKAGKSLPGLEYRVKHAGGEWYWHEARITPVFAEDGSFNCFVGVSRYVTERKRNEKRIEHLNRVLRAIREVNQIITHERDRDALLRRSCQILVSTRGYRGAWAALRSADGRANVVVENGIEGDFAVVCNAMKRGEWPECFRWVFENPDHVTAVYNTDRNCKRCPLSHAYRDTATLVGRLRRGDREYGALVVALPAGLAGDAGEQSLFHELVNDLGYALYGLETARRRREEEKKFQSYVENAPYGIFIVDGRGRFLDANPAMSDLTGYSGDELLSMKISDLLTSDAFEARSRIFQTLVQDGRGDCQLDYIRKNGDTGQWRVLAVALSGERYLGFAEDVTEREALEAQLRQAQKMEAVGRLAGGVAHDFNNMSMAVLGYVDLARESLPPDHPAREDLEEVTKATQRSVQLTRQLLAFARRQTVTPKRLDLTDTIASTLKLLQRLLGEDIDVVWIPGRGAAPVMMDPSQVDQILANLCVNARDAITGTGTLTIETDAVTIGTAYCEQHADAVPGNYVMLAVGDSGCGMSPETMRHIFEPFYTTKAFGQGTGLGLPTVHGIVKQNGGFITVHSDVGHGTTFRIYLPQATITEAMVPNEASCTPSPAGGTETLLLVEDEAAILGSIERYFRSKGYVVLAAASPDKALRLADSHAGSIQLLITDVVLPGMNGRELSNRLRKRRPDVKTLFMSGYTANVIVHEGILDDGTDFLQKPVSMAALSVKVRSMLDAG